MTRSGKIQGNAYFVTNNTWSSLAGPIRAGAEEGFNAAYSFGGARYLTFRKVSPAQIPKQLDFVDVIIRLGSGPAESLKLFNSRVWQQLSQALQRFSTTPQCLRARSITATKVHVGVAVALKDANSLPSVCISEGIVSLEGAWTAWKFKRTWPNGKVEPPGPVGSKLNRKELRAFGVSLGRCMAHEAWHQIILTPWGHPPYGNPHPCGGDKPGLECDESGSDWCKDKASFGGYGKHVITNTMPLLARAQGNMPTLELFRGMSD